MLKKKITSILLLAAISCSILLSIPFPVEAASELSLEVSSEIRCGVASTFTLQASGGTGEYMYYLGNITREGEDGNYFVMDPSRLPGYKKENIFSFTFLASGVYQLHFYVMDKGAKPIVTKRKIITVRVADPDYPSIEAVADTVAAQCRSLCSTDFERARWLHDWLLDHCTYDYSFLYCGAEGALVRGVGTCESYHRAYTMLLNRVGIANGRMEGNGHVWTAVRMDGQWYQVDVTWDDNGYSYHTYENYLYFGLNDSIMQMVHSDHSSHAGYESTALTNNYLIRSGLIRQWSEPLEKFVRQGIVEEKTSFTIPIESSLPGSTKNVIYSLAAYQLSTQNWSGEKNSVKIKATYSDGKIHIQAVYTPLSIPIEKPGEESRKESSGEEIGNEENSSQIESTRDSEIESSDRQGESSSSAANAEENNIESQESKILKEDSQLSMRDSDPAIEESPDAESERQETNESEGETVSFESEGIGSDRPTQKDPERKKEQQNRIPIYIGSILLFFSLAGISGFIIGKRKKTEKDN